MGWATKNTKRWEIKQLRWTIASIILFPLPLAPFVMMLQANRSKIRLWFAPAFLLLAVQAVLYYYFFAFIGASVQGVFLTLMGFAGSYILGNGWLLKQAKPYLMRLDQKQYRELSWINSIADERREALINLEIETPQSFVSKLIFYKKEIKNQRMQQYAGTTIRLFSVFKDKDRQEAEKFISRHGTVLHVLREYHNLENAKLNNTITIESKNKLESVLRQAVEAMEVDISTLIKNKFLDISVESDVYLQLLKNRNLLKD